MERRYVVKLDLGGRQSSVSQRKHHYITSAYLEGMLSPGESRLWVYERDRTRVFRNIPKNLGYKRGYYTIVRADGTEDDKFEEMLATDVEGPGILVLRALSCGARQLNWQEIAFGASLIAMQELRVPLMREQMESAMIGFQEQLMNFSLSVPGYLERVLRELGTRGENAGGVSADQIRDSVRSGSIRLQANPEASLKALGYMLPVLIEFYSVMKWTVLISENQPLLTSDAPVCRRYPATAHLGAGLINRDLEVYFPISHNRALLLTHDRRKMAKLDDLERKGRKREAKRLLASVPEVAYQRVTKERADEINRLVIERAYRWVYAPTHLEHIGKALRG